MKKKNSFYSNRHQRLNEEHNVELAFYFFSILYQFVFQIDNIYNRHRYKINDNINLFCSFLCVLSVHPGVVGFCFCFSSILFFSFSFDHNLFIRCVFPFWLLSSSLSFCLSVYSVFVAFTFISQINGRHHKETNTKKIAFNLWCYYYCYCLCCFVVLMSVTSAV